MARLIIMRGVPGSGKTTLANYLTEACDGIAVSADTWFDVFNGGKFDPSKLKEAHAWCMAETIEALYQGYLTIVHNTNSSEEEVQTYLNIAAELDVQAHVVVLENRHNGKSVHRVPENTIAKMRQRLLDSFKP